MELDSMRAIEQKELEEIKTYILFQVDKRIFLFKALIFILKNDFFKRISKKEAQLNQISTIDQ
jgi:hypothetical protein